MKDAVGVTCRSGAVRDAENGLHAAVLCAKPFEQLEFGVGIEGGGRLIQHQYAARAQQGPRYGEWRLSRPNFIFSDLNRQLRSSIMIA